MARDNAVYLDDEEKQELESATKDMFGTDEVPNAVTIQQLINHWRDTDTKQ
jgi:hypothetical protein